MIKFCKYLFLIIFLLLNFLRVYSQRLELYTKDDINEQYRINFTKKFETKIHLQNFLESYPVKDHYNAYITAGYDSIVYDTLNAQVKAYYTRGIKYKWQNVRIQDIQNTSNSYLKEFSNSKNVNVDKYQKTLHKILENKANQGYPFASIKLDSVEITETGNINGMIIIDNGKHYIFDSLIIKGDAKIKPYYVYKYLGIRQGETFSLLKTNDISRKIKNLSFLEEIRNFELAFADTTADVMLYLKDKKASQFSGLIGILPNNTTTGKLLITGDINLYLINIIGFGELFSFNWQKYEALSQTLKTEISLPYLFKTNFGLATLFNVEKKDSSYLNTDFTGKILFGSNLGTGFEVYYRNTSSFVLSKVLQNSTTNLSDNRVNLFGLTYRYSNLDNVFNPRSGIILNLTSGFGTKIYEVKIADIEPKKEAIFQNRSRVDIAGFIPVSTTMAIKIRNQTSMIYSKIIFNNELDFIGGLNSLRGFDEHSLPVTSYSILNLEFRYLFEEASCLFAFFDSAYFEKRYTTNDSYNYAMGIGMGLDLKTPAGIFSLAFAVGKQNENPFMFNNSKIHFGYKNYF